MLFRSHHTPSSTSLPTPAPIPSGLSLSLSSDNESFSVERDVAIRSVLIKNMIEGELSGVVARKAPAGLGRC